MRFTPQAIVYTNVPLFVCRNHWTWSEKQEKLKAHCLYVLTKLLCPQNPQILSSGFLLRSIVKVVRILGRCQPGSEVSVGLHRSANCHWTLAAASFHGLGGPLLVPAAANEPDYGTNCKELIPPPLLPLEIAYFNAVRVTRCLARTAHSPASLSSCLLRWRAGGATRLSNRA